MTSVADSIRAKLVAAFAPDAIEVVDDSERHRGHAGARPGGESHFRLTIVASAFAGLSRIERQRAVYRALAEELAGPVHALAVAAHAPGERGA
jgi:BolA protein